MDRSSGEHGREHKPLDVEQDGACGVELAERGEEHRDHTVGVLLVSCGSLDVLPEREGQRASRGEERSYRGCYTER